MKIEELNKEKCKEVLTRIRLGRLACSLNNQPFIVPLYFAFDGKRHLYSFSTVGKKIDWMRQNPLVCLEVDEVKNQNDWTTIIISGRYEELLDTPEFEEKRVTAHELLSKHPMWWQPAYDAGNFRERTHEKAIYFRILIEKISGRHNFSEEQEMYIEPTKSGTFRKSWLLGRR